MRFVGFSVVLLMLAGCMGLSQSSDPEDVGEAKDNADRITPADEVPASPPNGANRETDHNATESTDQAGNQKTRRGLFGSRRSHQPDTVIEPGTVLPFGEIGVVCGVRGRDLGKQVDRFPPKGRGYRLYDSNPSSRLPHTQYLTGFKDGCARQFTASLVMMGSPVLHEKIRYDPGNKDLPVTEADKAYERIKQRICKVSKGQPCPEKYVSALEKGMAFVTLYERFGSNAIWEEILLYKGRVAGTSLRRP